MLEKLALVALGYIACKAIGLFGGPGSGSSVLPGIIHVPAGSTPPGVPPGTQPILTSTAVNWPSAPSGLPPFPTGWKAMSPVTAAAAQRAWALLPVMQLGQVKYEQGPTGWVAYRKGRMGGKVGVTVYVPRQQSLVTS